MMMVMMMMMMMIMMERKQKHTQLAFSSIDHIFLHIVSYSHWLGIKEVNVLFNDTLNTFY